MIYISNELSHHGVKGMKWGVRKDPYTKDQIRQRRKELIAQAPSSNGKRRSSSSSPTKGYWRNASDAQISRLMDYEAKQAKKSNKKPMSTAKKVAIGVAVTAAAAGLTYAAIKTGKAQQIAKGAKAVQKSRVVMNRRKLTGHSRLLTKHGANGYRQEFYLSRYNMAAKQGRYHDVGRYGKARQEAQKRLTEDFYAGKHKYYSTNSIKKLQRKSFTPSTFTPKSNGYDYIDSTGQLRRMYGNRSYKIRT